MSETDGTQHRHPAIRKDRLAWRRPMLRRLNASRAEHGIVGGGDTPGMDMMS
jgi:hypothetical protein